MEPEIWECQYDVIGAEFKNDKKNKKKGCPRLLQTDSIAKPDSEVTGRESQQNGEPQTVVDGKNSYKSKCGHVIILPFMVNKPRSSSPLWIMFVLEMPLEALI